MKKLEITERELTLKVDRLRKDNTLDDMEELKKFIKNYGYFLRSSARLFHVATKVDVKYKDNTRGIVIKPLINLPKNEKTLSAIGELFDLNSKCKTREQKIKVIKNYD